MKSFSLALTLAFATIAVGRGADAQVFQGIALEDSSRRPVPRYPVALTRLLPTVAAIVSHTKTDRQGLFQLSGRMPGVYRLEFGDSLTGITYGPVDTVGVDTVLMRQFAIRFPRRTPRGALPEYQVDEPVVQAPNGAAPRYPREALERGMCGEVLVRFIVDTLGRADLGAIHIVRSTDSLFSAAVREGLQRMRYVPALLHGRPVEQLVVQPFAFTIAPPEMPRPWDGAREMLPKDPFRATQEILGKPALSHPSCTSPR